MAQPERTGDVTAVGLGTSLQVVRLDVVRWRRLNRQGVTESRTKENGTYPIPEGGKRMTLNKLSIRN